MNTKIKLFVLCLLSISMSFTGLFSKTNNIESISFYYAIDTDKQLPGNQPDPEAFGSYPSDTPWILRIRWIKLILWPGTGKIDAEMCFDMWARYGVAGILEERLWADSYAEDPDTAHAAYYYQASSRSYPDFVEQLIVPMSVFTESIYDDGYSVDYTFDFQYNGGGGTLYKYCVFAAYLVKCGNSYIALTSDLGAFDTPQPHLYLTS